MSAPRKAIDPKASQIRDTLRAWRGEMSQARAAREIGVDPKTVYRWEKGDVAGMEPKNVAAIAKVYRRPMAAVLELVGLPASMSGYVPRDTSKPARDVAERTVASPDELRDMVQAVREKATKYAVRKGQGAPPYELRRLYEDLAFSVRAGLERSAADAQSLETAVDTLVKMLTGQYEVVPLADTAPRARRKSSQSGS